MTAVKERFVVDDQGNKIEVVLSIEDYDQMLEELEELESIRAFDAAKASGDEVISAVRAFSEIEHSDP